MARIIIKSGFSDFKTPLFSSPPTAYTCMHLCTYMHVHTYGLLHKCFLILPSSPSNPNNEDKFPISVFSTHLRLNGFPFRKVVSNVVFICLCLYIIEERRKWDGRSLRAVVCPSSFAYWALSGCCCFCGGRGVMCQAPYTRLDSQISFKYTG